MTTVKRKVIVCGIFNQYVRFLHAHPDTILTAAV